MPSPAMSTVAETARAHGRMETESIEERVIANLPGSALTALPLSCGAIISARKYPQNYRAVHDLRHSGFTEKMSCVASRGLDACLTRPQ